MCAHVRVYSGTSAIAVPESMCLGAVICMDRCTWAFSRENSPLEVEIGCNPHGRAQTEPELFFHSLAVELRGASPHPVPLRMATYLRGSCTGRGCQTQGMGSARWAGQEAGGWSRGRRSPSSRGDSSILLLLPAVQHIPAREPAQREALLTSGDLDSSLPALGWRSVCSVRPSLPPQSQASK